MYRRIIVALALTFLLRPVGPVVDSAQSQVKLTVEALVARHLNSIGSPEARSAIRSRTAQGMAQLEFLQGGFGRLAGPAILATDTSRELFKADFQHRQYMKEEIAFDGQKISVARIAPEGYSHFGGFLNNYYQIIREGLWGGTLCAGWPLLNLEGRKASVKYAGLKKLDGQPAHRLDYRIRQGGDVKVSLYFDPESFRHTATTYTLVVNFGMRSSPSEALQAQEGQTRHELTERFSDFEAIDGMMLPRTWKIRYLLEGNLGDAQGARGLVMDWTVRFSSIRHNETLDPQMFVVQHVN